MSLRIEPTTSGLAKDAMHYQMLEQQPIEIMQRIMTPEEFKGFLWGNVIKYALRCGQKDETVKEMEKVGQYASWYVDACQGKTINPRQPVESKDVWEMSDEEFQRILTHATTIRDMMERPMEAEKSDAC